MSFIDLNQGILSSGELILINADDTLGSLVVLTNGVFADLDSYVLAANTYTLILAEFIGVFSSAGGAATQFASLANILYGVTQVSQNLPISYLTSAAGTFIFTAPIKGNGAFQAGGTIHFQAETTNANAVSAQKISRRIYGVV